MKLLPKCIWKAMFLLVASSSVVVDVCAQDTLVVDSVVTSNRSGIEHILLGNIVGLRVKTWSGTPGSQAVLNLRGLSLDPTSKSTMPLILTHDCESVGRNRNQPPFLFFC